MRKLELDQVAIETPCPMKWANLDGGDKQRFCGECSLHVHNLSAMTRGEAQELIEEETASGERVCVTFKRDVNGELVNALDVPRRRSSFFPAFVRSAASLLFGLVPLLGACKQTVQDVNVDGLVDPDPDPACTTELLGEMVLPQEQPVQAIGTPERVMGRLAAPQVGTTCEVPPPIEATGDDLGD